MVLKVLTALNNLLQVRQMFAPVLTNSSTISRWILMKLGMHVQWISHIQGSKLLGSRMSRTPKNGDGNPILGPGFPTGIVRVMDSFKCIEIAGEIQIHVFQMETQILIVISSPAYLYPMYQ